MGGLFSQAEENHLTVAEIMCVDEYRIQVFGRLRQPPTEFYLLQTIVSPSLPSSSSLLM